MFDSASDCDRSIRRRWRSLADLYNATAVIREPEITPVLRGSCRMQGPVDETDHETRKNTVSSQAVRRFSRRSMSQKNCVRAESGTCNVCSAPCSSCIHLNRIHMGSKTTEFSDESCHGGATSQFSINEEGVRSRACDNLQHASGETSNQLSVNSNNDSFSEHAESKPNLRSSVIPDASEDFEMVPKLFSGGAIAEDELFQKPVCDSNKKIFIKEDFKGAEGHDGNVSCVSGANDANVVDGYQIREVDRKNVSPSLVSVSSLDPERFGKTNFQTASGSSNLIGGVEYIRSNSMARSGYIDDSIQKVSPNLSTRLFSHKLELSGIPSSEEPDTGTSSPKLQSPYLRSRTSKSLCNPNIKDLEEDSSSHLQGKPLECSMEHKNQPKLEAETKKDSGFLPNKALKCSDQNEQVEKSSELVELPGMCDPPLQSPSGDESEESDILEHDVKVCDICGDAGREDLLAICSRCSDGAEHTYCMRQMVQKVPEGQWLCEECKFADEIESQKQGSDAEEEQTGKVSSSTRLPVKRSAENIDVALTAKRQVLEANTESPKSSSPGRRSVLSRDHSFKNLDKGKVRPANQTSYGNHSSSDIPESALSPTTGPRPQTSKGTLLKSSSFSTFNSKSKVKLVDEVLPPKQKAAREHTSLDTKDGPVRILGKSMSFKPANSGRSNAPESRFKMHPSKLSHAQDLGLKQAKERNMFERKNFPRSERPLVSSTKIGLTVSAPKIDQKLSSRGEIVSLSSVTNNKDLKVVPTDGKIAILSKSANRGPEVPVNSGGASSSNGMEKKSKSNLVSPKDEPSSTSSWTVEKPLNNVNGVIQDGLPRSRESTNQGDKGRESPFSRARHTVTTGSRSVPHKKCKEGIHDAETCTIVSPRACDIDVSATRSSREEMNKDNKLKTAITSAMLKKPGIYKKRRAVDQSDDLSMSGTGMKGELLLQDQSALSNKPRKMVSEEGSQDGQAVLRRCTSDSCGLLTVNNVKQLTEPPEEVAFSSQMRDSVVHSDGKPTMRYLPNASEPMPFMLKMSTIPEFEYIWQGVFAVHRGGKQPDLCDGLQAHLSISVSPKVVEVVNKFPHNVLLNEVPRLSIWPAQFHDNGAKEDNIALYFFAKDLESYERNYKSLLETMIVNDLALKGDFDGVELLIFPSNRLPEQSQRWNMLFFLWGVFRGKKISGFDHIPSSPEKLCIPSLNLVNSVKVNSVKDIHTAGMSFSEKPCLLDFKDENLYPHGQSCNVDLASNGPSPGKSPILSSSGINNGDCATKVSSLGQTGSGLQAISEQQDSILDGHSLSRIPSTMQFCPEVMCTSTFEKEHISSDYKQEVELKPSANASVKRSGLNNDETIPMRWDTLHDRPGSSSRSSKILSVGGQKVGVMESVGLEKIPNAMNSGRNQVKLEQNLNGEDVCVDVKAVLLRDLPAKEPNSRQLNKKRPYIDLTETPSQPSTNTSPQVPWNNANSMSADRGNLNKKLKPGISGMYGFASQMHDLDSGSFVEERSYEEKVIPEDLGTGERYLFPVDSHCVKDMHLAEDNYMTWRALSSEEEDKFHEGVPNLELALGAESKLPDKGILPLFFGMVDKGNSHDKPSNKVKIVAEEEEEDVSASLSLSLSFPFPEKEQTGKPVLKTEQLLPESYRANTSLFLFDGFSEK